MVVTPCPVSRVFLTSAWAAPCSQCVPASSFARSLLAPPCFCFARTLPLPCVSPEPLSHAVYSQCVVLLAVDTEPPFANAGIVSRLFFLWATPLFAKGNTSPLKAEDLWPPRVSETAADSSSRLRSAWQAQVAHRGAAAASLVRAVVRTWARHYVWPVLLSCVYLALGCLSSAVFLRSLLRWFESRGEGGIGYDSSVDLQPRVASVCASFHTMVMVLLDIATQYR
jgi:hypothetical protein